MRRTSLRRLGGIVATSALVLGLGAAVAQDNPTPPDPGRGEVPWGTARELSELARQLEDRSRALDRRESALATREQDLVAIEGRLTERMAELEAMRAEIDALLEQTGEQDEDAVSALVIRVEAMRDKQAAAVLSEVRADLAVEVLRRMAPSKAGKALAAMDPVQAADLGERMAARVDVPTVTP